MTDKYILVTDVSHHQGLINFKKMRSMGVRVCFMKRSEGNYYSDPTFDYNWKACQDADIIPDPYHFVSPYNDTTKKYITGAENADFFLKQMEGYESRLPLAGDVEKGISNTPELVTSVVQSFYQRLGYPNINYTADWFWSYKVKPWSGWKNSLLWVMSVPWYNVDARTHFPNHELFLEWLAKGTRFPIIPRATDGKPSWDDWMIWQFSHQGKGTDYGLERGNIDLDIAKPELLEYLSYPEPPPDPEEPPVEPGIEDRVRVMIDDKEYKLTEA